MTSSTGKDISRNTRLINLITIQRLHQLFFFHVARTLPHVILGNKSDAPEKSIAMPEEMRLAALNCQVFILYQSFCSKYQDSPKDSQELIETCTSKISAVNPASARSSIPYFALDNPPPYLNKNQ